jgi:hypothetical protein
MNSKKNAMNNKKKRKENALNIKNNVEKKNLLEKMTGNNNNLFKFSLLSFIIFNFFLINFL